MTWRAFAEAAPELAAFAETDFGQAGMALVATVRRDGSPRITACRALPSSSIPRCQALVV